MENCLGAETPDGPNLSLYCCLSWLIVAEMFKGKIKLSFHPFLEFYNSQNYKLTNIFVARLYRKVKK